MIRKNRPHRKEQRRTEAIQRQEHWDALDAEGKARQKAEQGFPHEIIKVTRNNG